jgi:hypothetical protein
MTAIERVAARYARCSDEELIGLLAQGENSFTPEAWTVLQHEVARRQLPMSIPEHSALEAAVQPLAKTLLRRAKSVAEALRRPHEPGDNPRADRPLTPAEQSAGPTGTGGWLALFQALVVLYTSAFVIGFLMAGGAVTIDGVLVFAVFTLASVVGLVLIAQRRPSAPKYWIGYLGLWVLATGVTWDAGLTSSTEAVSRIVGAAAWMVYWVRSKRVRATFSESGTPV